MHVLWAAMSSSTTTGPRGIRRGIRRAQQRLAALADHGSHTLLLGSAKSTAATTQLGDETIHTTANHPWLSADRGWIVAGHLQLGEPVQRVDGSVAVVVALTVVHGTAPMWDLTVSNIHDFAVGNGAYVVHNCNRNCSGEGWIERAISKERLECAEQRHALLAQGGQVAT